MLRLKEVIDVRIIRFYDDEPTNGDDGTVVEDELVQLGQLRLPNLQIIDITEEE